MDTLQFLYHTIPGRCVLKVLTRPGISKACGRFLDSDLSHFLIKSFADKNEIDLSEYELDGVRSFNDFFSRRIKAGFRPVDMDEKHLIAPCDGLLSVWKIRKDTVLPVKQSNYTISSLLRNPKLAAHYCDGYCLVSVSYTHLRAHCLVFRLCVNHYHRYCYVDSGKKSRNVFLPGVLHTVRPIALAQYPVFAQNSREYTLIKTPEFGTVVQMEVGAMLVGRIVNHEQEAQVIRGAEKGMFQYGGSTIIVLVGKDQVTMREDLLKNAQFGVETAVQMGETIGYAKKN